MRASARLALLALVLAAGCGPPLPPTPRGVEGIEFTIPDEILLFDVFDDVAERPYGPLVRPSGVTALASGRFVLADSGTGQIHIFDPSGEFHGDADEPANADLIPIDLAPSGFHFLVLDAGSRRVLRYDEAGAFRDVLLDVPSLDPLEPIDPVAMAADTDGRIAICDAAGHRVLMTGPFLNLDTRVGEYGGLPGQLNDPRGVCFGARGVMYVADRGNRRVQAFDRSGLLLATTQAIGGSSDLFVAPTGIASDRYGNLYVADPGRGSVIMLNPALEFLAEIGGEPELLHPVRCAVSDDGLLFVADRSTRSMVVYELVFP